MSEWPYLVVVAAIIDINGNLLLFLMFCSGQTDSGLARMRKAVNTLSQFRSPHALIRLVGKFPHDFNGYE